MFLTRIAAPLLEPLHSWSHILMDFIEGLPNSSGKNTILVIVNRFTKYGHFLALSHPFSAVTVAKLFLDSVYKLHGMSQSIVSDRDKVFTSKFWKELFTLMGSKLHLSFAYHPQSDGQTERLNRCLEMYQRCMTHQQPKQWEKWLALAKWWCNTSFHSAIGMTPFEALYGIKPPQLALGPYLQSNVGSYRKTVAGNV